MSTRRPHFLLFSEVAGNARQPQIWRFALVEVDGDGRTVAADTEPGGDRGRLELLAVVRALESIDGRARVTLVTRSRYVSRGLRTGLSEWRRRNWRWERFGRLVPVRDHDLWQRVDRALQFHQLECRTWRFDAPHESPVDASSVKSTHGRSTDGPDSVARTHTPTRRPSQRARHANRLSQRLQSTVDSCRQRCVSTLAGDVAATV